MHNKQSLDFSNLPQLMFTWHSAISQARTPGFRLRSGLHFFSFPDWWDKGSLVHVFLMVVRGSPEGSLPLPSCEDTGRKRTLWTRKRVLTRHWTCWHLDLRFPSPQNYEKWMYAVVLLKLPSPWYFVTAAQTDKATLCAIMPLKQGKCIKFDTTQILGKHALPFLRLDEGHWDNHTSAETLRGVPCRFPVCPRWHPSAGGLTRPPTTFGTLDKSSSTLTCRTGLKIFYRSIVRSKMMTSIKVPWNVKSSANLLEMLYLFLQIMRLIF